MSNRHMYLSSKDLWSFNNERKTFFFLFMCIIFSKFKILGHRYVLNYLVLINKLNYQVFF